jgi:ubiquinone/menaquinone biosynthesis C-methylase UbiE
MYQNESEISRVLRSKEETRASYNRISKWYDMLAGPAERKCIDAGLKKLNVKEGEMVLEIGFGTGRGILALAKSVGDSGKVFGIDISNRMCDITKSRVYKARLSERVELKCADAVKLSFESDFFDAIFMSFTLELFDTPEIPTVLQECQRILKRDGRLCVVAMSKKKKASLIMRLYEWAHKKLPKYVDCRPIYVRKSLEDTGFQILDVTEMPLWGLSVEIVLAKKV